MVTGAEAVARIFEVILELEEEEIKALQNKCGIKMFQWIRDATYEDFDDSVKNGVLSTAYWCLISDFVLYIYEVPCTASAAMKLTAESWVAVDVKTLRLNHKMAAASITNTAAINATNVKPSDIQSNSFFKYVNVRLLDKTNIQFFTTIWLPRRLPSTSSFGRRRIWTRITA